MTSSISWIDRDGLAETLARIGVGSQRHLELPRLEPAVAAVESETILEVVIPDPVEEEESPIPEFEPPAGALRSRLQAFMAWLLELSDSRVAFIVDRDGLPLVDRHADPDLLAIASSVMELIESIKGKLLFPIGQAVMVELEQGQLMLVFVETPIGKYIVGQVGDKPLSRELRSATAGALRRAFQPSVETEQPVGP